ncbi:MAG: hypothetical protein ACOY82_08820 [Pseudomonadota bacterium]
MTDAAYDAFRNRLESGGDDNAYNPRSGALGKHQFLASTWLGLVHRHQPAWAHGLTTAQILDKRREGALSDQMVALYDQDSAQQLARAGYAATPGNLYLAHHFGAAGARKILGATDDTPMQSLVTRAAYRANPHLHGKTKAQVLADFARRGGGAAAPASAALPAQRAAYAPFAPAAQATPSVVVPPPVWRPAAAPAPSFAPPSAAYTLPGPAPTPAVPTSAPDAVPFDPTAPIPTTHDAGNDPTPLDTLLRMLR